MVLACLPRFHTSRADRRLRPLHRDHKCKPGNRLHRHPGNGAKGLASRHYRDPRGRSHIPDHGRSAAPMRKRSQVPRCQDAEAVVDHVQRYRDTNRHYLLRCLQRHAFAGGNYEDNLGLQKGKQSCCCWASLSRRIVPSWSARCDHRMDRWYFR